MPHHDEEVTILVPSMEPLPRLMMQGPGGLVLDSPGAGVSGAACSDTSSGPVPALDSSEISMVPVPNLSSASLAAATAVAAAESAQRAAAQQQVLQQQRGAVLSLEALRRRRRLLFTQAPAECSEDGIKAWFSQFGAVEQVQVYGDPAQPLGSSASSTGLVVMASHEAAAAALAAMQGGSPPPAPLSALRISWLLQPDDTAVAAAAGDGTTAAPALVASANRTVFFAKVPPTALGSEVELLFGSFGKLAEVNLFRAWAGAKHSKGCGLVTYANRAHAAAAIAQLHGKYVFPGSDCPMVVEWIDLKKQRPMTVAPAAEQPPLGAAPDAYKLLLGNVPMSVSEDVMFATLAQFGRLVQLALSPDPAGPCASGCVWFTSKAAADGLLARSKAEPVWLHDTRSQHDLALAVKKARRFTAGGCSGGTASRVNVGSGYSNTSFSNNALMSSSSNSSSSLLPFMHLASMQAAAAQHSQELHSGSAQRLGVLGGGGFNDTLSMLANSNVMRLLPMNNTTINNNGLLGGGGLCDPMLDYGGCDSSGLGMGLPAHLQPSLTTPVASQFSAGISLPPQHQQYHHHPQLQQQQQQQQQRQINSQMMCMPASMVSGHSGQQCLSSPANIQSLDEFEGSFNMLSLRSGNSNSSGSHAHAAAHHMLGGGDNSHLSNGLMSPQPAPLQHHQMGGARSGGGMLWQQQPQQSPQPHHAPQQQPQQQQFQAAAGAAAGATAQPASLAVPIESYEVQVIAEHLGLFASHSGARVTITSLPGAGLAVMLSGAGAEIAAAQSLLAAARGK